MLTTARSVASLVFGIVLVVLGNGLLSTSVTLRMAAEGFGPVALAAVLCAYYLGLTAGALGAAPLIARIGHIRVFATMAAASAASILLLPGATHPASWIPLRALAGFAMAGMFVVVESWLNARSTTETRGATLAVYMIAAQLAMAGGQPLVTIYDPATVSPFIAAGVLHVVALIPISLTHVAQPEAVPTERIPVRALAARSQVGVVGCAVSGIVTSSVLTLSPLYLAGRQRNLAQVATFMLVLVASGLLLQWPLGRLSDRVGRRPVLAGVGALLAAVATYVAIDEPSHLMLLPSAALLGALAFILYPLALAATNDLLDPGEMVGASGTLVLGFGAGSALGPVIGTGAMHELGPSGLFYWIAAVAALFSVFAGVRTLIRKAIPRRLWSAFVFALPQAAPKGQLLPDDTEDERG